MFNALALEGLNQGYWLWHSLLIYCVDILFIALPYWIPIPPLLLCHKIILTSMHDHKKSIIFKLEDLQRNYNPEKKDTHMILNKLPADLLRDFEKDIQVEFKLMFLYGI
jgi:hypothetical protein